MAMRSLLAFVLVHAAHSASHEEAPTVAPTSAPTSMPDIISDNITDNGTEIPVKPKPDDWVEPKGYKTFVANMEAFGMIMDQLDCLMNPQTGCREMIAWFGTWQESMMMYYPEMYRQMAMDDDDDDDDDHMNHDHAHRARRLDAHGNMTDPMKVTLPICNVASACLKADSTAAQPSCTPGNQTVILEGFIKSPLVCEPFMADMEQWWTPAPTPAPTAAPAAATTTTTLPSNETGSSPTAAPVSTFTVTMAVESAADFDLEAFKASMMEISGTSLDNIVVEPVFVVGFVASFPADTTEDDIAAGSASMAGVPVEDVTVTLQRRLAEGGAARRLTVSAKVEIKTSDAAAADVIKSDAEDPAKIAAGISTATGKTISAADLTITEAPGMTVQAVTKVTSETSAPVELPTGDAFSEQLQTKLKEKTGKDFTVAVSEVVVETPTTTVINVETSTDAPTDSDESSGAMKRNFVIGCSTVTLATLLALASIAN